MPVTRAPWRKGRLCTEVKPQETGKGGSETPPTKHGKKHFWRHCKTNLAGLESSLTPLSSDSGERQEGQMWVDLFKLLGLEAIEEAGNTTGETKAELLLAYVLP